MENIATGMLGIVVYGGIGYWIYYYFKNRGIDKNQQKAINAEMAQLVNKVGEGFKPEKTFLHPAYSALLSVDMQSKKLLIARKMSDIELRAYKKAKTETKGYHKKLIDFDSIMRSEVNINGQSISTKSRTGAAVGGLLFGTAGAIIGGSGGTTKHTKIVSSIILTIFVKDIQAPTHQLLFYSPTQKVSQQQAQKACEEWHNIIGVILAN